LQFFVVNWQVCKSDPDDQQETGGPPVPPHHHHREQLAVGLPGAQSPDFGLDLWPVVVVGRVTWKRSSWPANGHKKIKTDSHLKAKSWPKSFPSR